MENLNRAFDKPAQRGWALRPVLLFAAVVSAGMLMSSVSMDEASAHHRNRDLIGGAIVGGIIGGIIGGDRGAAAGAIIGGISGAVRDRDSRRRRYRPYRHRHRRWRDDDWDY